jgi:regulator of protease activity HflC (stomatin/prohibitin superfamily)
MVRSSLALAALTFVLATSCNNASEDAKRVNGAQAEANDKSGAAMKEATDKVNTAQAEADEKIAAAQADFMKLREDYRHTTTNNLVDLDHKVADLATKASQSTGNQKVNLDANLKVIHASRDAFGRDYQSLDAAAASTWDSAKTRLDKEWSDLKALVDKA